MKLKLIITEADRDNLVKLLDLVHVTGLSQASMLVGYAKLIRDAAPVDVETDGAKPPEG